MYFSLIAPAQGCESAAAHERLRTDAYADHQWLWRFFPAVPGSRRQFLFRRNTRGDSTSYYVVSQMPPERANSVWTVYSREYAPRLAAGDRLQFSLRVNPVITTTEDSQSRRHDVVMHAKKRLLRERGLSTWQEWHDSDKPLLANLVRETCASWLSSRAERLGCEFDCDQLTVEGYQQHRGKSDKVRFSTVDFSGTLTVMAPAEMIETLYRGVGHARAFGCGLLLVRRII